MAEGEKKGPDSCFSRHYEMALGKADFLRLLPVAVGAAAYRIDGDEIASAGGRPAWRIRVEERQGRPFGPVSLPVLAVSLSVDAASEDDACRFVDRFLLGFQRAGG